MSEPISLSELTFIPQTVRNTLRRHSFSTSSDLLRARTMQLAKRLGGTVSIADVGRWQNVCSTLEIAGMSLPWARVLGEQGNIAARDLAHRKFTSINLLFTQALQRGEIIDAPDTDTIVKMMIDSARIDSGGVLNATVRDERNQPIKSAVVQCAGVEAKTDKHGRVRLLRLPLGQPVEVIVEKTKYATLAKNLPKLGGANVLEGYIFSMKPGRSTKPSSKRVLSEFDGDIISVSIGQRIRLIEEDNRKLRKGDILHFIERLENGEVKLSSRYKELRNGQPTILIWRLPSKSLPQSAVIGSDYRVTVDGLQLVEVTAERLARWRLARQIAAETKQSLPSKARLKRAVEEYIKRTRNLIVT